MTDKVGIGTIKLFDASSKRGVIVPRDISKAQISDQPVYFEARAGSRFKVGQLVQYVVDVDTEEVAKDVSVLSEFA